MSKASELREKIAVLRGQLSCAERDLTYVEQNCNNGKHDWGEPKYTPKYEAGYVIHGDPPGVGGIDHRSDFYVPAKNTPAWTRVCQLCGKTETTTHATETKVHTPRF